MDSTLVNSRTRIRDGHPGIIMRMDSNWRLDGSLYRRHDRRKLGRHGSTVCIAQDNAISASLLGGFQSLQRVFLVRLEPVKEVLRVINDLAPLAFEKANGIGNHRKVLLQAD